MEEIALLAKELHGAEKKRRDCTERMDLDHWRGIEERLERHGIVLSRKREAIPVS